MPEVVRLTTTYALRGIAVGRFVDTADGPDGPGQEGEEGAALAAGEAPPAKRLLGAGRVDGVGANLPSSAQRRP
eukprot:400444-Pyramimonas_sp.AAC.1